MKLPVSIFDFLESKSIFVSALILASLTIAILVPGIWDASSISGKDEYFLSLRTPLTMMEMDRWWVPWLDEAPRLKKPPMIYWLSRSSMEIFGANLFSARLVAVLLAALFIVLVAKIGELLVDHRYGLMAALITLSTMSLAVEGRRLMLDLPAATFSTLALYLLLKWWNSPRLIYIIVSAIALAAAVLTKGPLGLAVFGAGALGIFLTDKIRRDLIFQKYLHIVLFIFVFIALALPWFYYVYNMYPEFTAGSLQEDVKSRQLLSFSGAPISAVLLLLFPWSFILVWVLFKSKKILANKNEHSKLFLTLLVWLLISLLPFLFFRSFTRYMAGSILPMALICAAIPYFIEFNKAKISARVAIFFALLVSLPLMFFVFWFKSAWMLFIIGIIALSYFCVNWWQCRNQEKMIWSSLALWLVLLGIIYPAMGINALPKKAIELVQDQEVILYMGPQPAMLAIKSGKAYLRLKEINNSLPKKYTMIYTREEDSQALENQLADAKIKYNEIFSFKTLSSRSTWIKFARKGTTKQDWLKAFNTKSLEPIQSTIMLYQLDRNS